MFNTLRCECGKEGRIEVFADFKGSLRVSHLCQDCYSASTHPSFGRVNDVTIHDIAHLLQSLQREANDAS